MSKIAEATQDMKIKEIEFAELERDLASIKKVSPFPVTDNSGRDNLPPGVSTSDIEFQLWI